MRMPRAHQSSVWSWPIPRSISGDMYSGVPQKEFDSRASLASPKSANLI
jgi:hypothetical protein